MKERTFEEIGTHLVGNIELKEQVYVTDPCYDTTTWCQKLLDNVAPGTYRCFVVVSDEGNCGHRVAELHAIKYEVWDDYQDLEDIPYNLEPIYSSIGVDSGQCGIFDGNYYEKNQPDENWYERICALTNNAGITDGLGVACESGYGDGAYGLWVAKDDDGNVVAMKVVFIDEEEDEDDD